VGKATATISPGLRLSFSWSPAARAKMFSQISLYDNDCFVSESILTEMSTKLLID
jgi:hypothetical protein